MMTTEQIIEIIRQLPANEKNRIREELADSTVHASAQDKSIQKLLQISGKAKVGRFLMPNLDREFLYSEDTF